MDPMTSLWTSSQDWIGMDTYPVQDFKPANSTLGSGALLIMMHHIHNVKAAIHNRSASVLIP